MSFGITAAGWAAIAAASAAAIGAYSSIQQGNAAKAQAESQAQANEYNAEMQRRQAQAAVEQANSREDLQRKQVRKLMGKQLAAGAQSGTLLNGSAGDLFRESLYDAELDALNVRYEGQMTAAGLTSGARLSDFEAKNARRAGAAAASAGRLSAAGQLIGGAGSAYGAYKKG
jgi:hypothetical protein